ncbi:pilus assembly protein [Actimicrobium sp. CCC2.4]|uniref:pilus assembly PilX family protein n=1 Tax=Actimicrobium sp. CCC2.4 TaxID=3048606 RepID=UPI002AC926BA|nr:pilus assembly protein [Actimicrobium sp. CCC2.4]MEB0135125.1 pilus assembly protein [Actimicrobium sp. CCC2.4]WPX31830.1 pilus assembly protein [Actimicrobium sp. CCC2.4]
MNPLSSLPRYQQRGSVLIITVILVLLLTILGLGTVSLNTTQTRIATNSADAQISFQTAEGVLNQAQTNLVAGDYAYANFMAGDNGLYVFDPAAAPIWTTIDWSSASAAVQSFQGKSNAPGAYIIELLPSFIRPGQSLKKVTRVFRVTARAVGPSGGAPVLLQSTVQLQE